MVSITRYVFICMTVLQRNLLQKYEKDFSRKVRTMLSVVFGFGKDFESTHKVVQYPVKYIHKKEEHIYLWKK